MSVDDTVAELEEMCAKVIDPEGRYIFFVDWLWTRDSGEEINFEVGVRTRVAAYTLNPRVSDEGFEEVYGKHDYQVTSTGILLPKELAETSSRETVPFEPPKNIYISIQTALDNGPYLGD